METYVKTLRLVTVSLILLLLFAFTLAGERRQLHSVLASIEKRAVAIRLLKAQVADVHVTGRGNWRLDPECGCVPRAFEQEWAYLHFRERGSLYAQGQRYARNIEELPQAIRQTGGGELYLTTLMKKTPQLDQMEEAVHPRLPECEFPQKEADYVHDLTFFMPARVIVDSKYPSDLACGSFDLLFTNVAILVLVPSVLGGPECIHATNLMIVMPDDMKLYDQEALSDDILRLGRSVGVIESDPQRVYWEVRSKYERQVVQVPLVSQNFRIDNALIGAYMASLALLAWGSFTLRQYVLTATGEAWIIKEPLMTLRRTRGLFIIAAIVEAVLFNVFIVSALLTPAALLLLLQQDVALAASPVVRSVILSSLPVIAVLEIAALFSYVRTVRLSLAPRHGAARARVWRRRGVCNGS
jgi:hypothetical protein